MAESGHIPQEQHERQPEGPVTMYLAACQQLEPHPSAAQLRRLAALERASRRAMGQELRKR